MNIEELRQYCLSKKAVTESFPFDSDTLVFKVMGKIFLLAGISGSPLSFNVKCDEEKAIQLREQYASVTPGYHMNKKHWNTITADGSLTESQLREQVDRSYELVTDGLTKKQKKELEG